MSFGRTMASPALATRSRSVDEGVHWNRTQVAAVVSEQLMAEFDRQQLAAESAAQQVWKGAEDGRLLRVLVRLTSVLDRPGSDVDPQWAETGAPSLLPCIVVLELRPCIGQTAVAS